MHNILSNILTSNTIKKNIEEKKRTLINDDAINQKLKISYPLKPSYNTIIPMSIYQTWHTKILPPLMLSLIHI